MRIFPRFLSFLEPILLYTGAEEAAPLLLSQAAGADIALGGAGGSEGAAALLSGGYGAPAAFSLPAVIADNAVPLGLQAAGAGLKYGAGADALKRKQALVNAMASYQTGNADKSTGLVNKFLEGSTPAARDAATADAEANNRLGYEKTVGAAQAFEQPASVSGNLSDQYRAKEAQSADAQSARTKSLIESLSKMRAPGVAGAAESRRYGQTAGAVQGLNVANANVGNAYRTDMSNVVNNPLLEAGGDALSGIGQGLTLKKGLTNLRASSL